MNLFTRMIRSLQQSSIMDRGFENYYGAIVRSQEHGGPTASEARRDFLAARRSMDGMTIL
jgi:hypothetical protein